MSEASPLLESKLYVPAGRRGLVARPRLIERLGRGAESKLTLVSAPAGFGKTTLLAEWLAAAPPGERPAAWVSLDQGDNHPATFWTYLITALQTVAPGVGAGVLSLLQSPRPPPIETLLAPLLNELGAVSRDVVLVLDDYHVIVDLPADGTSVGQRARSHTRGGAGGAGGAVQVSGCLVATGDLKHVAAVHVGPQTGRDDHERTQQQRRDHAI